MNSDLGYNVPSKLYCKRWDFKYWLLSIFMNMTTYYLKIIRRVPEKCCFALSTLSTNNVPLHNGKRIKPMYKLEKSSSKSILSYIISAYKKRNTEIGKVNLAEGEMLFMKVYSQTRRDLFAKQVVFLWHYFFLGSIGSMILTSDFFMFDMICLIIVTFSASLVNGKFHKRNTNRILEIVLTPNKKVKVKTLTFYGGSKTIVQSIEDCYFSNLNEISRLNGKYCTISWQNSMMFMKESDLAKYSVHEISMRHQTYISQQANDCIDKISSSKELFKFNQDNKQGIQPM